MVNIFLLFALALGGLIVSSNLLLKFVEKFASRVKISPLVVGATLIAIGTSLPETSVALSAITQGVSEVSFGDIIGSNIANVCLILGIGITLFPVRIGTEKTQRNNIILLLVTLAFAGLFLFPESVRKSFGIFMAVFYIVFLIVEIVWGEIGRSKEDKKALAKMERVRGSALLMLLGTAASLLGLIISSKYLVSAAVTISKMMGVSDVVIGLSLIAVGTSLPELATTIASGFKRDWKLLYGDIQGSNIYNLSIIGAILLASSSPGYRVDSFAIIFMVATTLVIIFLSHKYEGTHIPKFYGILFLTVYLLYLFKIFKGF